jgi:hypothetical protein
VLIELLRHEVVLLGVVLTLFGSMIKNRLSINGGE